MLRRTHALIASKVSMIALLALNDGGAPVYNREIAAALAQLQVPSFVCTPARFPELINAAVCKQDLNAWATAIARP